MKISSNIQATFSIKSDKQMFWKFLGSDYLVVLIIASQKSSLYVYNQTM